MLAVKSTKIYWNQCPEVKEALLNWRQLIRESAWLPTNVHELFASEAAYWGTLNASGEGTGGI